MESDTNLMRLILLGIGIVVILAVYHWSRRRGALEQELFDDTQRGDILGDLPEADEQFLRDEASALDGERHGLNTPLWDDPDHTVGPVRIVGRSEPPPPREPAPHPETPAPAPQAVERHAEPPLAEKAPEKSVEKPAAKEREKGAERQAKPREEGEDLIIALHITAHADTNFAGDAVLEAVTAAGLRHGYMRIFHREEEGSDEPVFSLANLVKPGWFDPEQMEGFETPGLTLFMRLPGPLEGVKAFDEMYAAAKLIAGKLDGELRDETRSVFSKQTAEHIRDRIREFQLRARLKAKR